MPVKNGEAYLKACLDSIVAQSFTDWELIAIDDHSSDASKKILEAYAAKEKRMKTLPNLGQGIIPALQTAYAQANGTYITRMDADDLMTPDKLECFCTQLSEAGRGYITTGLVKYISEGDLGNGYKKYALWLNELTLTNNNFSDIYKECSIPSPNWMIHRADLDNCGAFEGDIYPEDYDLAFRFRAAGYMMANVKETTHHWRDYPTRTSRTDLHYSDNTFTALKVKHFLAQDYESGKGLVLWGAGPKGKAIAKHLVSGGIKFEWICNNPNKIGHDIYGIILQDVSTHKALLGPTLDASQEQKAIHSSPSSPSHQIILAISQKNTMGLIEEKLSGQKASCIFRFT